MIGWVFFWFLFIFFKKFLFFVKKGSWIVLILKYPADHYLLMSVLSHNTTINLCEFLKRCPAYFTGISISFSLVSWAYSALSVSFYLFLWSAEAHIAMGTMHTAREDFHYEYHNSEVTWDIIALPLPFLSFHNFFWFAQNIQEFPKHRHIH